MRTTYPPIKPNQTLGKLTTIRAYTNNWGHKLWECVCSCGAATIHYDNQLKNGKAVQCQTCMFAERAEKLRGRPSPNRIDMTGEVIGKLTVRKFVRTENRHSIWLCECACGKTIEFTGVGLRQDDHYSCGCVRRSFRGDRPVIEKTPKVSTPKPPKPKPVAVVTAEEAEPVVQTDWRIGMIHSMRKTITPWREIAELVDLTVEECKALYQTS